MLVFALQNEVLNLTGRMLVIKVVKVSMKTVSLE